MIGSVLVIAYMVKLSFAELDRRLSDLELQVKEIQEWRKKVESRLQS